MTQIEQIFADYFAYLNRPPLWLIRLDLLLLMLLLEFFILIVPAAAASPGDLDTSFGQGGVVTTTIGSSSLSYGVIIQPNGKILAGGTHSVGDNGFFTLARYRPDGVLDVNFGNDGIVTTTIAANSIGYDLIRQPDGRIVMAGIGVEKGRSQAYISLARYLGDMPDLYMPAVWR